MRHQWSLVIGLLAPCLLSDLCACPCNVTAVICNAAVPAFFLQEMFLNISEIDCICERGSSLFHPLILVHTECVPLNGKGDPPTADWCLPDRWDVYWGPQVRGMGWGGARGRILLVESVSDSTLSLSPPPHPFASSVRALLGGWETLSAALPHLGPNTHCGIVIASGDRRVG